MTVSWTGLNAAVINAFAEDMIITVSATPTTVSAVYFAPFEEYAMGGQLLNKPDHVVIMKSTVYSGTSASDGDTITVRGRVMQIVGSEADEAGMTAVSLREGVV